MSAVRWVPRPPFADNGQRWELFNNGRAIGRVMRFENPVVYTAWQYGFGGSPNFETMREAAVWLLNSLKTPG